MSWKRCQNGPAIKVTVGTTEDQITDCQLELHDSEGLIYCINGPATKQLSTRIDRWMEDYASRKGNLDKLPCSIAELTPFSQEVLVSLTQLSVGQSASYGELAKKLGRPKAFRAVGGACGKNPIPLIIPCHRVLNHKNGLGGFSCGLELKRRLLDFEGISYH